MKRHLALAAALACAGFIALPAAHASTVDFNDFSSTTGLTLIGGAATAATSDGTVLRLTPSQFDQSGAAYSATPITLGTNDIFST